jgi:hypothetical protein
LAACLLAGLPVLAQPDAGPPRSRPDAGPADAAPPRDAGDAGRADATRTEPPDWRTRQEATLRARLTELERLAEAYGALKPETITPPKELAVAAGIDFADPRVVDARIEEIGKRRQELAGRIEEQAARLKAMEPQLRPPIAKLERLRRRQKRWPRLRIRDELVRQATEAQRRLELVQLELAVDRAESELLDARGRYLKESQPARLAARRKQEELEQQSVAVERERDRAAAESVSAEQARQAALEAQRRARSEAERVLAAERTRLQEVRVRQAKLRQQLAQQRAALYKLRKRLGTFRGSISARADALQRGWPRTAPRYDRLYDDVVQQLVELRPQAIADLKAVIRSLPDPPGPGERLSGRVDRLDAVYAKKVEALEQLRQRLTRAADKLEASQQRLYDDRLALLQREITGLNEQRIGLLDRVTAGKRAALSGATRETVAQLSREVTQLIFDGLYWALTRLRQIDHIPRLIIDVFTVGSVLWQTLKLIFLLLLLRYLLRRWDRWMELAMQRASRSVSLGRNALRLAKLVDTLRHCGPALLVLIVASLVYQLLGGQAAATELRMVYIVFFWTAVYRLQLRLVESLAKYTGMERALKAADEEIFEAAEAADRPAAPAPAEGASPGDAAVRKVVPASVLLVRSVRAATRYILAVVLVLELTAMAVGEGTFYLLTAKFSWWAALPFVIYFLHLWRPHVERAYRERFAGDGKETTLERLVRKAQGRTYGVFVIGAAVLVLFGNRLAHFARRYLTSRDATKRLLAFLFRRRVEKHAQQMGHVVARRQDLPRDLVEQFPLGPLADGVGRQRPRFVDEILEVFANWQEDRSDGSVAVIGQTGMGKTTVLHNLERELGVTVLHGEVRTKITRPAKVVSWIAEVFGFSPRPSSEKELVRLIREDKRPVVAIDNCHNLFLRQVGGFEGWETFIRVVNETCDNVFWCLAFNNAAWDYLEGITGRTRYFRRLIQVPSWTEREIQRLIMTRMRRAGYGVSFSDLVVAGVEGVNISAQLGRTSQGYFRLLWDFTGGNPQLASYFWLNSLVPDEERRLVRVHLFAMPSVAELEALDDDILFVLTAVTQHQNLTAEEAARTTNLSRDFCNFAFRYCLENEYLTLEKNTGRSRLSMRWQRPIQRFLKRKHLLFDV